MDSDRKNGALPDEKINLADEETIEFVDDEELLKVAKRILGEHRAAFEELAK